MCVVRIPQRRGEHIQVFALRVDKILRATHSMDHIDDSILLQKTLEGLWPSIRQQLPIPKPSTLDELFVFAETIPRILSPDDSYWLSTVRSQFDGPSIEITLENEYATFIPRNSESCYKCGIDGHFGWQCPNPRDRSLKRKAHRSNKNKKLRKHKRLVFYRSQ